MFTPVIQEVNGRRLVSRAQDEDVPVITDRDVGRTGKALSENEDFHAVLAEDPNVVLALVQGVDFVSLAIDRELCPLRPHRTREVGERITEGSRHAGECQVQRHRQEQCEAGNAEKFPHHRETRIAMHMPTAAQKKHVKNQVVTTELWCFCVLFQ